MSTTISDGAGSDDRFTATAAAPEGSAELRRAMFERRLDDIDEMARHDPAGALVAVRQFIAELDAGDLAVAGRAQHLLGLGLVHEDRFVDALAALERSAELLSQAGERRLQGRVTRDIASLRGNQLGQTVEALAGYQAALSIAIEVGSTVDQGCVLNSMGVVFGRMERWEESERALRQAVDLLNATDVGTDLGRTYNNLGYLLALRGRKEEASATLTAAMERVDPTRDPGTALTLRCTLAIVRADLGDFAGALELLDVSGELLSAAGTYLLVTRLDAIGRVHLRAGDSHRAMEYLLQARELADELQIAALAVETTRHLVEAAEQAGDLAGALAFERDHRRREREMLDAEAASALARAELTLQIEASKRQNIALEATRAELAARVEERTAELRTEVEVRRRAEANAAQLARVDWLTGLPNRRHFEASLHEWLQSATEGVVGLCFVDLDHFKGVNDRYGHLAGDELLQAAAARLSLLAPDSLVARFGGDEFVIVLAAPSAATVERLAAEITAAFTAPLRVGAQQMHLTCSVGVAVHPDEAGGADTLLQRADNALLDAKQAGRGCWRRLDSAGWERVAYATRVRGELAGASHRNELSLAFQPQWRLNDLRCDAIEALLRWHHPTLGEVPPAVFIPIAEDGGLIDPIGRWVLERACRAAADIDAMGYPELSDDWTMGVNISVHQLHRETFVGDLVDIVQRSGWRLDRLELELTESLQLTQQPMVTAGLAALDQLGVRLAIDDFGTGYASFGQLESLGASKLKLDRSLIQLLDGPRPRPALPQAMIALGRSLGITVTAEGVATPAQLMLLAEQGCDAVQGFAIGEPVAEGRLSEELAGGHAVLQQLVPPAQ